MAIIRIVRGLPGSGKSTYARSFGCYRVDADMFHIRDGIYQWSAENQHRAHQRCHYAVKAAVMNNFDIVVSNTSTTVKEVMEYLDIIHENQTEPLDIIITEMLTHYGNIHDVPQETLQRMTTRWVSNEQLKDTISDKFPVDFLNQITYHTIS